MNDQRDPRGQMQSQQRPAGAQQQRPIRNANQGKAPNTQSRPQSSEARPPQRPSTIQHRPTHNPQRPPVNRIEALSERRRYLMEKKSAQRASVIAFLTVFLSLCLISGIILSIIVNSGKESTAKEFVVMNIEGTPKSEIPISDAYLNEMLYIDFTAISKLCGFSAVGDANGVTYAFVSTSGIDQYITFTYDSNAVVINDHNVTMDGIAILQSNTLKVPFSFVTANIGGLEAEVDEEARTVTITREKMTGSRPEDPKYEDIVLFLQPETPIPPISDENDFKDPLDVEFVSDLSAYEQYMNPADRDAYLVLINKQNPVDMNYAPDNLEFVPQKYCVYTGDYQARMQDIAAKAMTAMLTEAENFGINDVKITLAYRNYWTQNWLYTGYIDEEMAKGYSEAEAIKIVQTYSAPPGMSEHQSGLGADMHNVYNQPDKELEDFEDTAAYEWLKENCWKFGFVLRFPKGKEDITGFQFECWHFRFVGRYHAYQMYTQDLCLEEYLQQLANAD